MFYIFYWGVCICFILVNSLFCQNVILKFMAVKMLLLFESHDLTFKEKVGFWGAMAFVCRIRKAAIGLSRETLRLVWGISCG